MLKSLKDLLITLAALAAVAAVVWGVDGCMRVDNVHRTTGKPYRWEMDQRLGALPPDHPDHEKRKAELKLADEVRKGITDPKELIAVMRSDVKSDRLYKDIKNPATQ